MMSVWLDFSRFLGFGGLNDRRFLFALTTDEKDWPGHKTGLFLTGISSRGDILNNWCYSGGVLWAGESS